MKRIKRPNTIKMKRLLMHFIECNVNDRTMLRELQEDARKVIYIEEDLKPGQRKGAPARKKTPQAPRKLAKRSAKRPQRKRR